MCARGDILGFFMSALTAAAAEEEEEGEEETDAWNTDSRGERERERKGKRHINKRQDKRMQTRYAQARSI